MGGNDTLQLISAAQPFAAPYGPLTLFGFYSATLSSLEAVQFSSNAGEELSAEFNYGQISDGVTLIGGAGIDGITLIAGGAASRYSVPSFSFQNWNASDNGSLYGQDYIQLFHYGWSTAALITAQDNVPGVQVLGSVGSRTVLSGSNGNDALLISSSATAALGKAGDDHFELNGSSVAVNVYSGLSLHGDDGFDRLVVNGDYQISNSTISNVEALTFAPDPSFDFPSPHLTIDTASIGTQPVVQIEGTGTLTLNLSGQFFSGASVTFAPGANVSGSINGTALADTITGTSWDDMIYGNAGKDYLRGALGNDQLSGGDGNDRLEGGQGNDMVFGGAGNDLLIGGLGNDTANYSDLVAAGPLGVSVNLALSGAQDTGLGGIDTLSTIENLTGSNYNDVLTGNGGSNVLDGGLGADILRGGKGADILIGGLGADLFAFISIVDSKPGVAARDQILDFSHADGDRIDLSAIDANANIAGDQDFFVGGSTFTKHAGEIVQTALGGDLVVKADANGDGIADFALLLKGTAAPLGAADFIL